MDTLNECYAEEFAHQEGSHRRGLKFTGEGQVVLNVPRIIRSFEQLTPNSLWRESGIIGWDQVRAAVVPRGISRAGSRIVSGEVRVDSAIRLR